jgi:hypothetical protein
VVPVRDGLVAASRPMDVGGIMAAAVLRLGNTVSLGQLYAS